MLTGTKNGNRLAALVEPEVAPIVVVDTHVTMREVLNCECWPLTNLVLLPLSRRVVLKSNPHVVAMVRFTALAHDGRRFVRADALNSEWIGEAGGNYCFTLAEQLEAERLGLEGL